jgi:hypothetical protein
MGQGFQPNFTIADAGAGLRAVQKKVLPGIPYQGDVFHIQQRFETVANILRQQAAGATSKTVLFEPYLFHISFKL